MSDPVLGAEGPELPRDPLLGLRRRHQAAILLRRNDDNGEEDETDNPIQSGAEGSIENRYDNEEEAEADHAEIDNGRTAAAAAAAEREESTRTNLFSPLSGSIGIGMFRISRLYCFLSILLALIAIVLAPIPTQKIHFQDVATILHNVVEGGAPISSKSEKKPKDSEKNMNAIGVDLKLWSVEEFITRAAFLGVQNRDIKSQAVTKTKKQSKRRRWAPALEEDRTEGRTKFHHLNKVEDSASSRNWIQRTSSLLEETVADIVKRRVKVENESDVDQCKGNIGDKSCGRKGNDNNAFQKQKRESIHEDWQWIDPIFWEHGSLSDILTNLIDKILKSTIRLCIVTNFFLTMTYLLHSAVAAWFLSNSGDYSNAAMMQQQYEASMRDDGTRIGTEWSFASPSGATAARERMGGFLIFKLLLISAVLTPDALDLMILVTWFTMLGCLRSLDHLAHSTNLHLIAVGQPPKKGIVQLLFWVLSCNIVATGSCVALFHTAGYGMVLLLTCDCALLGTDAVSHILKYFQSVWENTHDHDIRALEGRQLRLHRANEHTSDDGNGQADENREDDNRRESERLNLEMEDLELAHSRRLALLDTAIFCLDMTCHILTVAHFCHIWALHGVQFTLIDGVLALHLHSAISTACAKLHRRRNVHRISRDLEGNFPNATDEELKQAAIDGDVCCICLGSMSKGSNVKKAQCGHMYHTHCLREVIERAQSLESAKCPLCRAPLVGDCHSTTQPTLNNNNFLRQNNLTVNPHIPTVQGGNREIDPQVEGDGDAEEQALFRFSTEGILPAWLPVPGFSFEVVRRPPIGVQRAAQIPNQDIQAAADTDTQRFDPVDMDSSNEGEANLGLPTDIIQEPEQYTPIPFFQRLLLFTGLLPMSPEEEARALAILVDMFPQYDRSDLLRELQNRGSLEAVTEAILIGIVPGVPRFE